MKNFRAADETHAGGDEKHDINFHWPYTRKIKLFYTVVTCCQRYPGTLLFRIYLRPGSAKR
jgi:hypothetical protein